MTAAQPHSWLGRLPRPLRFLLLSVQLLAVLLVFRLFELESPLFMRLAYVCFAGFAIHYWVPAAWRYRFYVAWSVLGSVALLGATVGALLLLIGLVFFGIVRLGLPYWIRIVLVILVGIALMVGRTTGAPGVPSAFWPVIGSLFMFRMIVYLYDLRFARTTPRLIDFLGYFYLLPNYYFLLFPVVDHQTYLVCRDRRPLDVSAQVGIHWIVRGTVQLLLYRLVEEFRPDPAAVEGIGKLLAYLVLTYLLYMRVSGQFHIAIGMLHLFGFDLPETHRRYLLASSIADFWRRINIYWKDFIVKVFYLPVFFRLRRSGELRAAAIATVVAFLATWLLHSYQWYWLLGSWLLTWPDTLFWAILGLMMVFSTVQETRQGNRPPERSRWRHAFGLVRTFLVIILLWSLWQSPSIPAYFDLVTLRGGA